MAIVFYLEALGCCHNILQIYDMWGSHGIWVSYPMQKTKNNYVEEILDIGYISSPQDCGLSENDLYFVNPALAAWSWGCIGSLKQGLHRKGITYDAAKKVICYLMLHTYVFKDVQKTQSQHSEMYVATYTHMTQLGLECSRITFYL